MFANPAFQINFLVLFFCGKNSVQAVIQCFYNFFLERQQELIRSFVYVSFSSLRSEYL